MTQSHAKPQLVLAKFLEVVMCATCFLAGDASKAPVDGLPREAEVGVLYFRDDVAARELCCAGLPLEPFDGVDDGISAAWTGVGELRL